MSTLIKNISIILQKMVRVKLLSLHATAKNSIRKSNNKGELMRGRYGERISIYSEDSSVPTQENEFRFCTSHFYNQGWNWTWKNNLLFCNRERQASVSNPPVRWIFITRFIPVEPKFLSLIGKLSVRDNQLFMNWYGKPIGSLLRSESISVLRARLYNFRWIWASKNEIYILF